MTDDRVLQMLSDKIDGVQAGVDRTDKKIDCLSRDVSDFKDDTNREFRRLREENNAEHTSIKDKLTEELHEQELDIVALKKDNKATAGKVGALIAAIVSVITSVAAYAAKAFIT